MATNNTPDVAAKVIGAQLQSLLKIPPIQKAGPSLETNNPVVPEGRQSSSRDVGSSSYPFSGRSEEKDNKRGKFNTVDTCNTVPHVPDDPVPRDRFGRPFQTLDRRSGGRGREREHQAGNRRYNSSFLKGNQVDDRVVNDFQANRAKAPPPNTKSNQIPQTERPPPSSSVETKVDPNMTTQQPSRRTKGFPSAKNGEESTTYRTNSNIVYIERPGRHGTPPPYPPVHLAIPELLKHPNMPHDIKKHKEVFHERNILKNESLWNLLRVHYISNIYYRRNPKFPRAVFYCNCCNYHIDTLAATLTHLTQDRHLLQEKMGFLASTLYNCPPPSDDHATCLTDLVLKTCELESLDDATLDKRFNIVERLSDAIKKNNLGCQAVIFGSSVPGFCLRNSNVNININVGAEPSPLPVVENGLPQMVTTTPRLPASHNPADFVGITTKLINIIKTLPHVTSDSVKETYTTKCVSIHFYEEITQAPCVVHFNNTSAVLTSELFAEYESFDTRVKPLVICFRLLARLFDIDDPEKGFLPPHCYTIMVIFFLQRKKGLLPILNLIPHVPDRPFATAGQAKRRWKPKTCNETVGELWLQMLKYFSIEFPYREYIISISQEFRKIDKEEKQWNRRICIEDPIIPKSNLSRTITNNKLCDYIIDRFRLAAKYFSIPRSKDGPLYDGIMSSYTMKEELLTEIVIRRKRLGKSVGKLDSEIQKDRVDLKDGDACDESEVKVQAMQMDFPDRNDIFIQWDDAIILRSFFSKDEFCYEFNVENFTDGLIPPIICKSCGSEGHLKPDCPEETVPPFLPVDRPSQLSISRLTTAININFGREAIDSREVNIREKIVEDIKSLLLPVFPSVTLQLFGSTLNGFGMHSSDIDICFTLNSVKVPPGERGIRLIDSSDVIENIEAALKSSNRIKDVKGIVSAKVPIVKFHHCVYKADGDISLYNTLSNFNTEMLKTYTDLDERVAPLGLFLKKLVKICTIGDASKGSLSSYCYILMLIHFLQNHNKPVLPVLQELDYQKRKTFLHCDGHCVDYENNIDLIKKHWKRYGKNKETVGQLWLGFLNYYVEKFDNENFVITISQSRPLTRQEKCWHTEGLAIEDPFDKSHNLGTGLTRRMSVHILKTFQKCRIFFHQSTDHLAKDVPLLEYYLDPDKIRFGSPPIDRQCRICSRIGHYAKNCTYRQEAEDDTPVAHGDNKENFVTNRGPTEKVNEAYQKHFLNKIDTVKNRESNNIPPANSIETKRASEPLTTTDPAVLYSKLPNGITDLQRDIKPREGNAEQNILSLFTNQKMPVRLPVSEPKKASEGEMAKNEIQPVKEVVFVGDMGGTNAEGDRIQAMLQKNEGVTFTFDLGVRPNQGSAEDAVQTQGDMVPQQQPPPGFCPPSNIFPSNITAMHHPGAGNIPNPMHNHMFSIQHSQSAPSMTYGHAPVVAVPYQPMVTMASAPFENRPPVQANGDNSEHQQTVGTAPPPGFAPLSVSSSSSGITQVPHELVRTYNSPFQAGPSPIGAAPIIPSNINYQQQNGYPPVAPNPMNHNLGEQSGGFRHLGRDEGPQHGLNFEVNSMLAGPPPSVPTSMMMQPPAGNLPQAAPGFPGRQDMVNRVMPNGHPNCEEPLMPQSGPYMKPNVQGMEPSFNAEYPHGNSSNVSYGLSLSQAHHAPVVSALQMHHSQHHPPVPIQGGGGHFHHTVRPFIPVGNFPGNNYSYPGVQVPPPLPPQQHIQENAPPIQGGDVHYYNS